MNKKKYNFISRDFFKCGLLLPFFFLTFFFIWNPYALADNWLHFGYDSQYTSYNPVENKININNISELQRNWGIGCDDGWFSVISRAPAIYRGKMYTSGAGDKLTAYSAHNGKLLWKFGKGNNAWAPQPVVSEDGIVFYMEGSIPTNLYAVSADNGTKLWEAPFGFDMGFNDTALVTVDELKNLIYVVEPSMGDGKLYALNKQTGAIVWSKSKATDKAEFKGDYVLLDEGKIFIPASIETKENGWRPLRDHMLKIDTISKNIETTFNRPKPEGYHDIKHYALCNDMLIVGFDYSYNPAKLLVAYNPKSPTIIWEKEFSEFTGEIACNKSSNRIYVSTDPYLYALDASTGAEVWKYQGYGAIYNPSIANGIVYFISDTNMYAINETTGAKLFSYPLGYKGYNTTQVAINNGMVFFSGNGGTCDLFALGLPFGKNCPGVLLLLTDE